MPQSRRDFFQKIGIFSAGTLLAKNSLFAAGMNEKIARPGIQLWSVQKEMTDDAKGTLKQLASFGYKQVESFEGKMGMFWGMQPKEFKAYLESLGMTAFGSHCGDWDKPEIFEKKAADAADAGMKYLLCPSLNEAMHMTQKSISEFKPIADNFNKAGDICKKYALRFGYHTHGYPFMQLDGQRPFDYLAANTNADTVDFELDIYWVVTAGADPIQLLEKYKSRIRLVHIKDRTKGATEENASCIVGQGSIDFPKILKVAKSTGVKYFTVEQETFVGTTPMLAAAADAKYVLSLDI